MNLRLSYPEIQPLVSERNTAPHLTSVTSLSLFLEANRVSTQCMHRVSGSFPPGMKCVGSWSLKERLHVSETRLGCLTASAHIRHLHEPQPPALR